MPSLFNRRSRSVSTSRPTTPASSSAHMAAAQAFLANKPSSSALSASAAAAALRTMSPQPTPVDQIQTKRMLNRQSSNSSVGSAARGRSRGTAQRRPSVGSMTERTFRSPSPGQQASSTGPSSGVGRGAPPVPPVPQSYSDDYPPVPAKTHRRSASMDALPLYVSSPPKTRSAAKGQTATTGPPVSNLAAAAARKSTNTQVAPLLQRSDSQESRNSINFSYPRGSRPNSPPPKSPLSSSTDALPMSAANGISSAEVARIQNGLNQTAGAPVKKKKKRVDPSAVEGSHLHSGTMGSKPIVTPLEPLPADYIPPEEPLPVKKTRKAPALSGQSSHFPDHEEPAERVASISDNNKDKRAQRASGALQKQPSVVREDWEGEQEAKAASPVTAKAREPVKTSPTTVVDSSSSRKVAPAANMSRKIEDTPQSTKPRTSVHDAVTTPSKTAVPSQTLVPTNKEGSVGRGVSISPSRSTRFSDRLASDLTTGRKHEPLGRSISPAKSALKHSAGADASPTDPRFPGRRGSSVTPSEASDVSDGVTSKKRSVRVSFEAASDGKDTSNASKESSKRNWLGIGKGKSSSLATSASDDEVDEGMKPRPALPSFGSVRRNERSVSPNANVQPAKEVSVYNKSPSSSEASSIADPPTMNTSISSDHALGGLLSKESQKAQPQKSSEPVPPTVTSVEGTGYETDTDSVYSDDDQSFRAAKTASKRLSRNIGDANQNTSDDAIPVIAVQPATPGIDDSKQQGDGWAFDVPGTFPHSGNSSNVSIEDEDEDQPDAAASTQQTTGLGLSDPAEDYTALVSRDTSSNTSPQQLTTITEEDSDAASVYSDAAEDLSDLEGDGFGSINAIVESPVVTSPAQRLNSPPESPLATVSDKRPAAVDRTTSWDDTQAHWSGLAQRVRNVDQSSEKAAPIQKETAKAKAANLPVAKQTVLSKTPAPVTPAPKKQKARVAMVPGPGPAASPAASQASPSAVVATKQVSSAKNQSHFRSSMRGQPEPTTMTARQRPASYAGPATAQRAALQKKHIPPVAVAPAPVSRRFSNDSDSDSSFKRARRNRASADGKYTMKRSMRGGPAESVKPSLPAGRGGVRSLSPPADRRPTSPMGAKTMRSTMRGSFDQGTPTLRAQPEKKRSSSLFSRNRTAKSPTRPSTAISTLPGKLKSRIADSDDEDGPRPTHYQSRFADSSDEDEPKTLRPVRGIPRKKDEGDSTDLDDSSDDQARKSKPAAPKKLAIVAPTQSQELLSPPLSPTTAKKRGLWSRLRGKRKDEEPATPESKTIPQRRDIKDELETNQTESSDAKQLGFNSAAERDALIEQTRLKLESAKEAPQSPVGRPGSPMKLQRRITPQRVLSDSYALPKMPATAEDRPQTSGGDGSNRPAMASRQPTLEGASGDTAVYGKSGKKKKFGLLRRAFGLTD